MHIRFAGAIFFAVMLIPALPAFSGECEIHINRGRISGSADNAPLGRVMDILAKKTGYAIFMDKRLEFVPVSFSMSEGVDPEPAVKQIIKPNGYAITYMKTAQACEVQAIRIFKTEPDLAGVDYRKYSYEKPASSAASVTFTAPKALSPHKGKSTSSITRKDLVKERPAIKKDVFGAPKLKAPHQNIGPDYRPPLREMRMAHRRFTAEKKEYREKAGSIRRKQIRRDFEKRKQILRRHRNREIKRMIDEMKSNTAIY